MLIYRKDTEIHWAVLKKRLKEEGADQLLTNCKQLKLKSSKDGKRYKTDVANTEQLLRIIQAIPSPKAEPFKRWLSQIGRERIEETIDPELTDERKARGVKQGKEFAILTDEITRAWAGLSTRQYKKLKGLKKENLRDNMTTLELVLNMLAEATTTDLSKAAKPTTFQRTVKIHNHIHTLSISFCFCIETLYFPTLPKSF